MNDVDVYVLDEAERSRPKPAFAPKIRRPRPRRDVRAPRSALPAVAGSLSLLLPGAGQLLMGETKKGVFFASAIAFLASLVWAIFATLDRLVPTLELLAVPTVLVVVGLGFAFACGCVAHVAGTLQAHGLGSRAGRGTVPPPAVAGLASLLVPGWGQLLAGHRLRSALFLGALWVLAAAWIAVTPPGQRALSLAGVGALKPLRHDWAPFVLVGGSALAWVVAIYDAIAGAHAERRR